MKYVWVVFEKVNGDEYLLNINDYKIGLIKYENKKYYVSFKGEKFQSEEDFILTWEITKNCYDLLKQILLSENFDYE